MGVTFNLDAMVHYYEADCKMEPDTSRELAARVLRRAEVSKAVRRLQNMMQLARFKMEHGWEDWTSDQIERHLKDSIKEKHRHPIYDTDSTEGSALSMSHIDDPAFPSSSTSRRVDGHHTPVKRTVVNGVVGSMTGPRRRGRPVLSSRAPRAAWKDQHQLAQSSPTKPILDFSGYSRRGRAALARMSPLKQSTALSPAFNPVPTLPNRNIVDSDDENHDPILQSFDFVPNAFDHIPSSPPAPRTPSPAGGAGHSHHSTAAGSSSRMPPVSNAEDAGLLMYLANSPSTTTRERKRKRDITPDNDLPSSFLDTPNGKDMLNGHKSMWTPGPDLNIYDFVNATPSPGQLQLGDHNRTPRFHPTPLMGPPAKKPHLSGAASSFSTESISSNAGLGMSFEPKLVS